MAHVLEAAAGTWPTDRGSGLPIAFGPVRSRRLGWSLGINNVPPKTCTYACVYCQVGATDHARLERESYSTPDEIAAAVAARFETCRATGQQIDVATFVPDGEPTLDLRLGEAIEAVAALGTRVAVLTNGSLLWRDDVREEISRADIVSVKLDAVDARTWRRLNRPIGHLRLEAVLDGLRRFAAGYRGELLTETMIVAGVNDDDVSVARVAHFASSLGPRMAYVAIPTRPPAEPWVRAPSGDAACRVAERFRAAGVPTTCLTQELEAPFAPSEDPMMGLLGIVAVHPMTMADARTYLDRSGADWSVAQQLIDTGRVVVVRHGRDTYLRAARPAR